MGGSITSPGASQEDHEPQRAEGLEHEETASKAIRGLGFRVLGFRVLGLRGFGGFSKGWYRVSRAESRKL